MRQIIFRAKRKDGKGWAYGDLIFNTIHHECVIRSHENQISYGVDPETICRYINQNDWKGTRIFEKDVIRRYTGCTFEVKVREYQLGSPHYAVAYGYEIHPGDEVIGNVFDHPSLVKS